MKVGKFSTMYKVFTKTLYQTEKCEFLSSKKPKTIVGTLLADVVADTC